ncbi:MAG: SLATT domain-containing protein [Acidobacteria bacterium]|nr:SLATT domain-containing protein [Acidobacteriota bacterium]
MEILKPHLVPYVEAIRESFGRVVYSHKTHEKAREIQSRRATWVKWINIVLTTATSAALLSTVITNERAFLYVSTALSAASLMFVIFQLSFDPGKEAERHRNTAKELWYVREKYVNLLSDIKLDPAAVGITARRDELIDELNSIYKLAPDTSSGAYKAAQKALKVNEEMTFSGSEIDEFLPESLHLK